MSDKDTPGPGGEANPEPLSTPSTSKPDEAAGESWFERLRAAVGLRGPSIRRELEEALEETTDSPFAPEERLMLTNILGLRDVRVEDIMIPRADIEAIDIETTLASLLERFQESGHSRMPVFRESLDDPVGLVHIKDLLGYLVRHAWSSAKPGAAPTVAGLDLGRVKLNRPLAETDLVRDVLFVPPSMPVPTLLQTMQKSRVQLALVIDEYGGTDGLVSIEDAVETIVGEIEDEYDDEEPKFVTVGTGVVVTDGSTELDDVVAAVGETLLQGITGDDFDTIGGMVFSLFGRIPAVGETVTTPSGYRILILDADTRRIRRVRISAPTAEAPGGGGETPAEEPRQLPRAAGA